MTHALRSPRRRLAPLALTLVTAGVIAGCGGSSSSGDAGADPAAVVPAGAPAYVVVTVHPTGQTKANVERLSQTLFGTSDPGGEIVKQLERSSAGPDDLDFRKDIEPWLGDRVALALTSSRGSDADLLVAAASRDDDKAEQALKDSSALKDEASYRDVDYRRSGDGKQAAAVLDSTVVFGPQRSVRLAIDATKDDSALADETAFKQARAQVPVNGLVSGYVKVGALVQAAAQAGGQAANAQLLQSLAGGQADAIAATLNVNANNIRLEAVSTRTGAAAKAQTRGDASAAVAALPGDAWLGLGLGDIEQTVNGVLTGLGEQGGLGSAGVSILLDQVRQATGLDVRDDLLSWMGSGGIFVEGVSGGDIGGGLIVQAKDTAKMRSAVRQIGRVLPRLMSGTSVSPLRASGVDEGVRISGSGAPAPLYLAAAGDRFILAIGQTALRDALDTGSTLGDAPGYKAITPTLGGQVKPSFYLDFEQVATLVRNVGGDGPDTRKALEVLGKLTQAAAGGRAQGDASRTSAVLGVRE